VSQVITPDWLTLESAHQWCGISVRKLERHVKANDFLHKFQGVRLINRESLDAWIMSGDGHREASVRGVATREAKRAEKGGAL
jgi:ribosomal protein S12